MMMTTRFFLLLLASFSISLTAHILISCKPCAVPSKEQTIWLEASRPPCLHAGQPIITWPDSGGCPISGPEKLGSSQIGLLQPERLVLAKERICFYDGPITIFYRYSCAGKSEYLSSFRVGHSNFRDIEYRRMKRWARRRNPDANTVHFQQDKYVRELPEDTAIDTIVAAVKATHASKKTLYYSMVAPQDSRSQNLFTLDTTSGEIRLAKSLDREVLDKHILKVTAYERTEPTVLATTTVVIHVLDVQDNAPIFEKDSYFGGIREDAPIGTTVLSVFARDMDSGENGEVEYSLGEGNGKNLLSINSKSGVVQTSSPLDRETLSIIRLDVIANDKGTPKKESKAFIEITVIDVNDNAPVFESDSYNITISENITLSAMILTVKATDNDAGQNGKVHYSMASSSGIGGLTIDYSTGEVTLRERIDAKNSPITAIIRAKDGAQPALSSTVPLTINVIDINDHAPTFIAAQKLITLEENVAIGEEVGRVYAIDEDSGPNGVIQYTLDGSDDFMIDRDSGVIRTTKLLDRETIAKYNLKVTAGDMGTPPLNTSTVIIVVLKDVNDNAPIFEKLEYNVTISEELPRGSQIITLKAVDNDEDQKIVYKIEEATRDIFSVLDIGEQGAIMSISGELNRQDHVIRVEVSATDQGGLQGRCVVNVFINDVNSAPTFVDHPFSVKIPEHSPIGYPVITLKAHDHDRGQNAKINYSIDSDQHFKIDQSSGELSVAADLDREDISTFTIQITATDHATPPLSTSTQLEVILDDINDNAPQFTSSSYAATISEDIPVGTSFLQVSAIDADIGANGIVDYFLNESTSGDVVQLFRLDRTSGTLRVNSKLDREQHALIVLPIYARDRGSPELSSSSEITLTISDINDNAPSFEQSSYDLYIAENSAIGSVVGTIIARDPDDAENADISFRIFGGADAKLFDIEEDGLQNGVVRILSRAEFDYEAKTNKFFFELQASSGQLSSIVPVRIHVSDINDNKPILKDFVILMNRFDDVPVPNQIGFIPAFDPDQNATLEYFLEENDLIEAEKYTGKILVKQEWKRNMDVQFKSCVSDGPNTECATCRFIHVLIEPEWLAESVTISMSRLSIDDFWDPMVFQRFRDSISTLSPNWKSSDVHVISVKQHSDDELYISIVVLEHGNNVVRGWRIIELVKESIKKLEKMTLLKMEIIRDESCANEPCAYMSKCRQTQKFVGDMKLHETDNFIARTLNTINTFVCECPNGFTSSNNTQQCDTRIDECYKGQCMNNSTCVAYESNYRCECRPGWIGRHCEISINALTCVPGYCMSDSICELEGAEMNMRCRHCKYEKADSDERCRLRSLTFDGNSLLNLNVDLPRTQWTMKFSVSTIAHNGILVFTGDKRSDYVEISIVDRVLKAQFSLGGEKSDIKMENDASNRINDGEWHLVKIEYSNRQLIMSLDNCQTHPSLLLNTSPNCAARAVLKLEKKCADPTVPCYRYLDVSNGLFLGGRPGQSKQIEKPFDGCISDLYVDDEFIDFSSFREMHKVGNVQEGCKPKRDFCSSSNCSKTTKCVNRWNGRTCGCPNAVHSSECATGTGGSFSLFEEESYILYEPATSIPFEISFDFRTSRTDMQIVAIEFSQRSLLHYNLQIDDGQLQFTIGDSIVPIPTPSKLDFTNVVIKFDLDSITTLINGIYSGESKISIENGLTLEKIYFGIAPGTGHPSRFEGCIRNVMVDQKSISIKKKGKTRQGCIVPNRCSIDSSICPTDSVCHRKWNKHECRCHKGYISDTCLPICSIPNICSKSGQCVASINSTNGYECICQMGKIGDNCQFDAPMQICPNGWWGKYPKCQKCSCAMKRGYEAQCDRETGACLCHKSYFSTINGCVKCECGIGSDSNECDGLGYCKCNGDAVGRRCDRCSRYDYLLDSKSLKCKHTPGKCPSEIEYSIQWPTSIKGSIVRQSCPIGESGLATRKCQENGRWSEVNSWNCTRPEYSIMVNKFDILEPTKILAMISNATLNEATIRGRNQQIAAEALVRVIEYEEKQPMKSKQHIRDMKFTKELIDAMGKVMNEHPMEDYSWMIQKLWSYSKVIAETHQNITFLPPFFISNDNIVFASDKLDFGNILPKFNNFIDTRPSGFPKVKILVTGTTQVVYSIIPFPRCTRCENPMVSVLAAITSDPIIIEYEIEEEDGWKYPECVRFNERTGQWSTDKSMLIGLNLTHAACEYYENGIFTMFVNDQSTTIVRVSNIETLQSPIIAAIALVLCIVSILLTIMRRTLKNHSIRIGFILFFAINILNLFFVHKTAINQAFCPIRNAMLSFTTCAPFSWLFLYGLFIYRMLSDDTNSPSLTTTLLVGIIFPSLISFTTFLFTDQCSLSPNLWLFWFIILPIGLFLLLSFYAAATSILVSLHKKYDVFVAKYNVKRAVFHHFLLTLFTLIMTLCGLFANQLPIDSQLIEIAQSVFYLIGAAVIFLWTVCDIGAKSSSSGEMWLEPQKSLIMTESVMADAQCSSPLLPRPQADWHPDIIPNDRTDSPPRHHHQPIDHILSPADKILNDGIGHVYGNSLPRLQSAQDEADDAYYTYTSTRRYNKPTTFNRD